MAGIGNNLYPAIVPTYMPAFARSSEGCKVYFSLSIYNNVRDIEESMVQVIVMNQTNNQSVVDSSIYPTGVMLKQLQSRTDENKGDYNYYINITRNDLKEGFLPNQLYKVQLRLVRKGTDSPSELKATANWLESQKSNFSEWSSVCIIKSIAQPILSLEGFQTNVETIFASELLQIAGNLSYADEVDVNGGYITTVTEKEYLKSYEINIYNGEDDALIYNSGKLYPENENEIFHLVKQRLQDGNYYKLNIKYLTSNGYEGSQTEYFRIIQAVSDRLHVNISAEMDPTYGRMKVIITPNETATALFLGNLAIRRTSSETNYTIWEDVYLKPFAEGTELNMVWYDYTVKSGVWYKYGIQKCPTRESRGIIVLMDYPKLAFFEDIFLTRDDMQICIKYNPTISSYRKTLSESKIETIGSKYPFFKRNAKIEYRQFSISGLITSYWSDDYEMIAVNQLNDEITKVRIREEDIYGKDNLNYDRYKIDYEINNKYNYLYEREFRERVEEFLCANTVKLFRSLTEGNMLIKLTDVSLSPENTLGRMLYSFSATAYEVDDFTIDNCKKYGIQDNGYYDDNIKFSTSTIGQYIGDISAGSDLFTIVEEKYNKKTSENYKQEVEGFTWVRIEFNNKPYMIKTDTNGQLVKDMGDKNGFNKDSILGHIVTIDNASIIVGTKGYYELLDKDTFVKNIVFKEDENVTIDYMVKTSESEDTSKIAKTATSDTKVGQLYGTFINNKKMFNTIYSKYFVETNKVFKRITSINSINMEFEPNTVIYVKDSYDKTYNKHIIGYTGVLYLKEDFAVIEDFYISGIQLYNTIEQNLWLPYQFNYDATKVVSSLEEVRVPASNTVYTFGDKYYIFFRGQWEEFEFTNEEKTIGLVKCDVEGLIDYIYEIIEGEY